MFLMVCKGICTKYKIKKSHFNRDGRYALGQKRCSICEIFVKWEGIHCPCCNFVLRVKPRNTHNRRKFQEVQMIKRA